MRKKQNMFIKPKRILERQRIIDLEIMNRIASKSKLTKNDVEEISNKIKKEAAKRFYLLK